MKYTFLLSLLVFISLSCGPKTPAEQELNSARQLCNDITKFIYDKDYKADKCEILDFIKDEIAKNFAAKTYYSSVELVKGTPPPPVPCPEKIMKKNPALVGRFKPLGDRVIDESNKIYYYIEQDKKVDIAERKIRVKLADRGDRYIISAEILLDIKDKN